MWYPTKDLLTSPDTHRRTERGKYYSPRPVFSMEHDEKAFNSIKVSNTMIVNSYGLSYCAKIQEISTVFLEEKKIKLYPLKRESKPIWVRQWFQKFRNSWSSFREIWKTNLLSTITRAILLSNLLWNKMQYGHTWQNKTQQTISHGTPKVLIITTLQLNTYLAICVCFLDYEAFIDTSSINTIH